MANIVYGYGKLGMPQPELFAAIEAASLLRMHEFLAQNMSNIIWAYGTLGYAPGAAWLDAATSHILSLTSNLTSQNLSNIAWGCAKIGFINPQLEALIVEQTIARISECSGQSAANTVWALATLGVKPSRAFMETLANYMAAHADKEDANPQHLANMVWGYANIGFHQPFLFGKIAGEGCGVGCL
jgi:hypothetical protein